MVDINPQLPPEVQSGIDSVEQYLRQGEPLLAYNAVQDALRVSPGNLRLRQLKGLALARSGDVERANQLLSELAAEGTSDAETLGMLARTHKDLALKTTNAARRDIHFASAFGIYSRAYEEARRSAEASNAWYTGINAATIAVLQGNFEAARRIAGDVRDLCGLALRNPPATTDYWLEATLGEAALILGDDSDSLAHYARAANLAAGSFGNLASTRRQVRLLANCLPGPIAKISEVLKIPPVVMYTGHMIDQGARATPRFPIALERVVAAAVREKLAVLRPLAAYGSAACGSDILCLEAMREIGGETHIVLPFPAQEFHRASVDFASGGWGERFERALAAADSVTVTSDHRARGSSATFEYANLVLTGMARLRAQVLQTDLRGLAVWDGRTSAGGAGAAALVQIWQSQDVTLEQILIPEVRANASPPAAIALPPDEQPAGFSHENRAMLFADAVGYSALSEDQTPNFISQFLGAVADLNARTAQRPEHVETTGDGLYMVFGSVRDAGYYALELNRLVTGTDWASRGLPGGLNIRIALHCGPVYCGRNPVTGSPLYTGPHTSRTARIEPVTPPGQVYASSAFAAVAAAMGVDDLAMQYIGRMPLAKGYGLLGLYHLCSASPR
jgi:class 3 adenylate cyclase/tetratricopeptide (TPR) repeat protein